MPLKARHRAGTEGPPPPPPIAGDITAENHGSAERAFFKAHPTAFVMIRPDRKDDAGDSPRYAGPQAKAAGDAAMAMWFEYWYAKGFAKVIRGRIAMLRGGRPIMVVCADPITFDPLYAPPPFPATPRGFFDWLDEERQFSWSERLSRRHAPNARLSRMPYEPRREDWVPRAESPEEALERLATAPFPTLSDEAKERIGL